MTNYNEDKGNTGKSCDLAMVFLVCGIAQLQHVSWLYDRLVLLYRLWSLSVSALLCG